MTGPTPEDGCGTHSPLGAELRALAVLLLERLAPALERARTGAAQSGAACASCPVCAALALVRGERPELAARLAEHASALLDALAAALEEPAAPAPGAAPAPTRRVQRIPVERPVAVP
jgi:hypothetical protein